MMNVFKLIQLYEMHRCLWDPTDEAYKDYHSRKIAYEELINELGVPGK